MYRNLQRHSLAVASREDPTNLQDITWYWVKGLVVPTPPIATIGFHSDNDVQFSSITAEVVFYTKDSRPAINDFRVVGQPLPDTPAQEDFIHYDGEFYGVYGMSSWSDMGRYNYREVATLFDSRNVESSKFRVPPKFQEEYEDFIDSVSSIQRVINLSLIPLCIKIDGECNK